MHTLTGKPEGDTVFGRSRRRWASNIKMDMKEIGSANVDLIHAIQDRDMWYDVQCVTNTRVL
jgi:hypothetical protein